MPLISLYLSTIKTGRLKNNDLFPKIKAYKKFRVSPAYYLFKKNKS